MVTSYAAVNRRLLYGFHHGSNDGNDEKNSTNNDNSENCDTVIRHVTMIIVMIQSLIRYCSNDDRYCYVKIDSILAPCNLQLLEIGISAPKVL